MTRMTHGRLVVATLGSVALGWSVWTARPSDLTSPMGWLFAAGWTSAAWSLLLVGTTAGVSVASAIGALVTLAGSEVVFRGAYSDGFFLAVKPLYQLPIAVFGAALGHGIARLGAPNA